MRNSNAYKAGRYRKGGFSFGWEAVQSTCRTSRVHGMWHYCAFSSKGKLSTFKLMKTREDVREAYIKLGEAWNLSDELLEALEKVTCSLCTPSTATASNINDVRYNLFCAKNGEIESHLVAPCKDCLSKHAMRANYQACIWRRRFERNWSFVVQWVWAGRWKHVLILKFLVLTGWKRNLHHRLC